MRPDGNWLTSWKVGGVPDGIRYVWPALPVRGEVHRRAA
jgi:hypothetical protein